MNIFLYKKRVIFLYVLQKSEQNSVSPKNHYTINQSKFCIFHDYFSTRIQKKDLISTQPKFDQKSNLFLTNYTKIRSFFCIFLIRYKNPSVFLYLSFTYLILNSYIQNSVHFSVSLILNIQKSVHFSVVELSKFFFEYIPKFDPKSNQLPTNLTIPLI